MKTSPLSAELTYFRGRVALKAMLEGLGVGPGDEVAIQAFTCLAVPEAVLAAGALPVYADVARDGCNMDPASLQKIVSPKVKAIVMQHTFGVPAPVDEILEIARRHGIPVIEDCCHTLASTHHGRPTGSFGVGSFYSFEWGKPLVAGLGGCAEVNDPGLAQAMNGKYGSYPEPGLALQGMLELQYLGFQLTYWPRTFWPVRNLFHKLSNLRLLIGNFPSVETAGGALLDPKLELMRMAALPRRRLKRAIPDIDAATAHSREISSIYREQISSPFVAHVKADAGCDVVYARYPLFTDHKKELLAEAERQNIEIAEWYSTPIHPLAGGELARVGYQPGACREAELSAQRVVTLPTNIRVTAREARRIAAFINSFVPAASKRAESQPNQADIMNKDFTTIAELAGDEVSTEQIDRLAHRYYWAGEYCKGRDVLEAGCGAGQGLGYLGSLAKTLRAGDISSALVARARSHYGDRFEISEMDAQQLPFPDHSLDVVILFEAIYYLQSAEKFVAECRRVLRPGGKVLIATANKDLFDFNPSPFSQRYFGVVELGELFGSQGFSCEFQGNIPVTAVSWRQRALRPAKALAVRLNLIPQTMAGKKLLKRLVFGRLVPMPAEIARETAPYLPPNPLAQGRPDHQYKVIYLAATLKG